MRIEVKLEQLIMDAFPAITEEDSLIDSDGVHLELWSGQLATLVAAILVETNPGYSPYQEE